MKSQWIMLVLLVLAFPVWGQEDSPLLIIDQGIRVSPSGRPALSLQITNQSSRKVIAYVVLVEQTDSGGKLIQRTWTNMRGIVPTKKDAFYPGESWIDTLEVTLDVSGKPLSYKLQLDHVRFADNSKSWGPDVSKQSLTITGIIKGRGIERDYLRDLLRTKGSQAVTDELSRTK